MNDSKLSPNQLAFLALCNEYCHAIEQAQDSMTEREEFVEQMLRLLPRIYISATDLHSPMMQDDGAYIPSALEEDFYDSVRNTIETLLGEDDSYLEVFEEDMKYSDTPIGASISEGLADLFQVFYNLTEAAKDAPVEIVLQIIDSAKEDFETYWSQPLCNVLRALNSIRYK